ncbi:AtpZ/AtpI family protein [Thermodesulfobacteriota bacterium]
MSEEPRRVDRDFPHRVEEREKRKLRARRQTQDTFWFGFGMFGMVGWSVAIPTVAGIFFGIWIDLKWTGNYSWTLMLMMLGLIMGCVNAWFWVNREKRAIDREREDEGD